MAHLTFGDLAQRGHTGLVLGLDLGQVALSEHAGSVGSCQNQLEAFGDLLEAIFDGDEGHGGVFF
jgi:hypothetical protein